MLQLHSKTEKKKVLVAKLPSEVSVPDVYLVFKEVHPSLQGVRFLRQSAQHLDCAAVDGASAVTEHALGSGLNTRGRRI